MIKYICAAFIGAVIGLSCAVPAKADTVVGVHLGSAHIQADQKYNNVNPGAYIVHNGYTLGSYYNSIKKVSIYAGYTLRKDLGPVEVGLTLGGITGYRYAVAPLVAPSIAVPLANGWAVRGFYLPRVKFTGAHVLHVTVERRF